MRTSDSPSSRAAGLAAALPLAGSATARRVVLAAAGPAAALGALGVAGWASGSATVAFMPRASTMVPFVSAAVLLLALSLLSLTVAPRGRWTTWGARAVGAGLFVVAVLSVLRHATGLPLSVEGPLVHLAARVVPSLANARVAPPIGASCVALLSLGLLLATGSGSRRWAGLPAFVAAIAGAVVCLGYVYAEPLYYRDYGRIVAWPGAAAFFLLGVGIMADAGSGGVPLSLLAGPSARAIILRRFLPVTLGALLLMDWVTTRLLDGLNPALGSALSALLVACAVAAAVVPLARAVGAELDRALAAARESEKHFREIFEHATIGLYRTTPDGRILLANPALLRMLGYESFEALAQRNLEAAGFESGHDRRRFRERIESAGEVVGLESAWTRTDGGMVSVRESARVVRDDAGVVLYYEGTVEDITERRRAEEALLASEEKYRLIADNADDWVLWVSPQGDVRYSSPSCERLTGYSAAEFALTPSLILDVVHPEDRGMLAGHLDPVRDEADPRALEYRITTKAGEVRWIRHTCSPIRDSLGRHAGRRATNRDVTERKRAEVALQASVERYRTTLDGMLEGCQIIAPDWRYLYLNDAAANQGRRPKVELVGRTMVEMFPGIDQTPMFAALRECMERRVARRIENEFSYPDGSTAWFALSFEPVPEGVFILSLDVSDRRRAEEALRRSEAHFRTLFDNMQEGLAYCRMIYRDGRPWDWVYESVNESFAKLTGLTDVEGRAVSEAIPGIRESDPRLFEIYGRVAAGGVPERFEMFVQALEQWFAISVYSPEPDHFVAVFDVITDRKRAEAEIQRLNADLERRVAERTAELKGLNAELEAFTYSVSHDLRAPLRQADGFAKILLEEYSPRLDDTGRHYLDRVREGTRFMGELVDDLLNLSRVGRRELAVEEADLGELARAAVEDLRPACEGHRVEWNIGELPRVACDRGLMRLVFANLLANAVKFSRPRDPAVIEVGQVAVDGRPAVFVRDNGVGFDPKYVGKLFGVFQRLHRQEDFDGTGVGLATVQRIVHRHGGRVWAEGAVDRGATFFFSLGAGGGT